MASSRWNKGTLLTQNSSTLFYDRCLWWERDLGNVHQNCWVNNRPHGRFREHCLGCMMFDIAWYSCLKFCSALTDHLACALLCYKTGLSDGSHQQDSICSQVRWNVCVIWCEMSNLKIQQVHSFGMPGMAHNVCGSTPGGGCPRFLHLHTYVDIRSYKRLSLSML